MRSRLRVRAILVAAIPLIGMIVQTVDAQTTHWVDGPNCSPPGTGTAIDPFCAIQSAVMAATVSDLILVAPGVYVENVNIQGRALTVRSIGGPTVTTIFAAQSGQSVIEDRDAVAPYTTIDGFTITGGNTLIGGGLLTIHTRTTIQNCIFRGNTALRGGGILNFGSFPLIRNCLFIDNMATDLGGGVYNDHGWVTLVNCTFVRNVAAVSGGGFYPTSTPVVTNCIFWDNLDAGGYDETAQIHFSGTTGAIISDSIIMGLNQLSGMRNIGADPLFVDAVNDDFRLLPGSPAIDAGDTAAAVGSTDLDGGARRVDDAATPDTGIGTAPVVDFGAFEFGDDCNGNGVNDALDISTGTSSDCDANGVPDECETDCNSNAVADVCDISNGTSADCTNNGVPDECEADCNANLSADSCDIAAGSSQDCNGNAVPDECDIASGASQDLNGSNVPDECETPETTAVGSRYIEITPALGDDPLSIRITSPTLTCLSKYVLPDGSLSANPFYLLPIEWHVVRAQAREIIPGTAYHVSAIFQTGPASPAATVTTFPFGEVDNNGNRNFLDVVAIVDGYKGSPTALSLYRTDIYPCTVNGLIDFLDVSMAVDAFKGKAFASACPAVCP